MTLWECRRTCMNSLSLHTRNRRSDYSRYSTMFPDPSSRRRRHSCQDKPSCQYKPVKETMDDRRDECNMLFFSIHLFPKWQTKAALPRKHGLNKSCSLTRSVLILVVLDRLDDEIPTLSDSIGNGPSLLELIDNSW